MSAVTYTATVGLKHIGTEVGSWLSGSNHLNDLSLNNLDLTVVGSISQTVVKTGSTVFGSSGYTSTNYQTLVFDSDLNLTSEVTCIAWIKADATPSAEAIVGNFDDVTDSGGYMLYLSGTDGYPEFRVRSNTPANKSAIATTKAPESWIMLAGTMSTDGVLKIYVDGILQGTTTGGVIGATAQGVKIGVHSSDKDGAFNGDIAGARILPEENSATQILSTYNAEKNLYKENSIFTQVGVEYSLDLSTNRLNRSEKVTSKTPTSLGGQQETVHQRTDILYDVGIRAITKVNLPKHRTFLQSVSKGETFTFDPYGTVASSDDPFSVIKMGGHVEQRIGTLEFFDINLKLREL